VPADPQVRRIVVEPDARNDRAVARLLRLGFTLGPEIDKPEKRARPAFVGRAHLAAVAA
jgi:penicillin amidase